MKQFITIEATIAAKIDKIWSYWTNTDHIVHWNFASPEWHCPSARHDLKVGGSLNYRMEAKDGSMGFDYTAKFTTIKPNHLLEYVLDDGRTVSIKFHQEGNFTKVVESFEVEDENNLEMQRQGWLAILNNFKAYVEADT
jgi:uncharacterized protein YndB with AHSA1/START domain